MNNDLCHGIWKHTSPHLRYKVYIYSVCQLSGVKHTFNGRTPMWIEEIVWKSCLDRKMFINVLFCCFVFLSFVVECVLIVFCGCPVYMRCTFDLLLAFIGWLKEMCADDGNSKTNSSITTTITLLPLHVLYHIVSVLISCCSVDVEQNKFVYTYKALTKCESH